MKFICNSLLALNFLVYVFIDVIAWGNGQLAGILFLAPVILFPIVVFFAKHMAISKSDKFFKSEWDVFLKKIKWSNSAVLTVIIFILLALNDGKSS